MNLSDSCGIPAGLLRLLKVVEEDVTEPISWNLQKSKDGSFSLKFWTSAIGAKKGDYSKNQTQQRRSTARPRDKTPVILEKPSLLDSGKVSPVILEQPKSSGKRRKPKPPSVLKRDRQRRATWSLKQRFSRENRKAAARQRARTGSVTSDADSESSPEQTSSGPEFLRNSQALEGLCSPDNTRPEGVFQEFSSTLPVEEAPGKNLPLESTSTVVSENFNSLVVSDPNTPEGSESDGVYSDSHLSLLDSDDEPECERPTPTSKPPTPELCVNCGVSEGTLRFCSVCKAVKYCSIECQRDNWRQHKLACAELKRLFQ